MSQPQYELGSTELEVLRALWDAGPGTVRQVLGLLHERGKKVAYTTVLTLLTRLESKGYVRSDKSDLAYVYRPTISREQVTRSRLRALLDQLYDGAAGPVALTLMKSERFSAEEIEEMQRLIERLEKKNR